MSPMQLASRSNPGLLLVGNFLSGSRASRSVSEELAARLHQRSWSVITVSDKSNRLRRLLDMLATVWWRRSQYDVAAVEVYSGPAFVWAEAVCWMLRRVGKPYILTLHGGNLPAFSRRWPRRVARLLAQAHAISTPSGYLQSELSALRSDIRLIANPIATENYAFKLRRKAAARLVWLRAFHRLYNPMLAIDTLARLVDEFPAIELVMVGPDKGDGTLQHIQQASQRGALTGKVRLVDGVPKKEVAHWLGQGDIFLNTASIDNAPVSVTEAMACGLCIVSTNVGGIPDLLQHEKTALLVPPADPEAMAQAIRRIISEPELARQLSENAQREAQRFDWRAILPEWEALFRQVARQIY